MGKSNLKIIFLTILYWHICTGALAKDNMCEIITGEMKIFECDQMTMFDVNRHLSKLASMEKSAEKPINVRLMHITFNTIHSHWATLPAPFFNADIQVKYFMLSDTTLFSIEGDAFNDWIFMTLESLSLIRIPIRVLGEGAFNGLTNLKILNLEQMNIISIEPKIFEPLPNLESVLMRYCGEQKIIVDNMFGGVSMNKLRSVTIEFCNLKDTITEATFSGLRNVNTLQLSKNEIQQIGPRSFHIPLRTLRLLKLDSNDLKSISSDLFPAAYNLGATIELNENPWHCDCDLANFQIFLWRNSYETQRLICKTPLKYAEKRLDYNNNLCNEKDESVAMDGPIESTTQMEQMTEIDQLIDEEETTFSIEEPRSPNCGKKMLNISTPSKEKIPSIRLKEQTLFLEFKTFKFVLIKLNEKNEIQNCIIGNDVKDKTVRYNVDSDRLQRFCSMEKGSTIIKPLDCVNVKPTTDNMDESDDTCWILADDRTTLIVAFCLSLFFGFIIGLYLSVGLAKLFPKLIQWRQNTKNNQTNQPHLF